MSSSVSPRSSALSSRRVSRSDMPMEWVADNVTAVLAIAAVVACIVVAVIAKDYEAKAAAHAWNSLFRNGPLAGVALLAVLGCTAWVTGEAFHKSDSMVRQVLLGIFVLAAVVLAVIAYLFFRKDDIQWAFYLSVALTVAVLVHTYLCWKACHLLGVVGMVPALLLCVFLLYHFWPSGVRFSHTHAV